MKGKKILGIGLAVGVGIVVYTIATRSDRCPVDLPSNYRLIAYSKGQASSEMALLMQLVATNPGFPVGTSEDWLFESKGTIQEQAWQLLLALRKHGDWRQLKSHDLTVYSDDGISPRVVMIPCKLKDGTLDPTKHLVRVNGDWRTPGPYERLLSQFPKDFLEKWSRDHSSPPTRYR